MRVVITWRTKARDEQVVNLLSEESWVPENQADPLVVAKGQEILASLPLEVRQLAEPQLKGVLFDKSTQAWGIVTGETKNQRVIRFRHESADSLREVAEKVSAVLESSALGHFDERDAVQILEQESQRVTLWGVRQRGTWGRALSEKSFEAWLAVAMLALTVLLAIATWPRSVPELRTVPQFQRHWMIDSLGRVLTATFVTFVVSTLQVLFRYWENKRHQGIRWTHDKNKQGP